jgi:hypothetical protein
MGKEFQLGGEEEEEEKSAEDSSPAASSGGRAPRGRRANVRILKQGSCVKRITFSGLVLTDALVIPRRIPSTLSQA